MVLCGTEVMSDMVQTGRKIGGTMVDREIHKLLSRRFGAAFDSLGQDQVGQGSKLMQDFEWNKRIYGNENAKLKDLRLFLRGTPDSVHYDSVEGGIILTEYAEALLLRNPSGN